MSENDFFIRVWGVIALMFITLFTTICAYNIHRNIVVKEMVLNGTHPIEAKCAIEYTADVCALRAVK